MEVFHFTASEIQNLVAILSNVKSFSEFTLARRGVVYLFVHGFRVTDVARLLHVT